MNKVSIHKIVIITAMHAEALPIINKLGLIEDITVVNEPFNVYKYKRNNHECILLTNGECPIHHVDRVCTQPAAITTWEAIRRFSPDIILNAGTAGGFSKHGAKVKDIYLSTGTINYHDRRIALPGFKEYGLGHFPCLSTSRVAKDLNLKQGKISTGNSLDLCEADIAYIEINQAQIKDMEAAAIAEIAWLKHTPMMAIKAITDLIDASAKTEEAFMQNLTDAVNVLADKMQEIVAYLYEKSTMEL